MDDEGPASADVIDEGRPPAERHPRRHVGFGVGVAVAVGVVVAVVGAGTAVGGPGPAPAPIAATSRVLTALDPMPVQAGPAPAASVLRATAVHLPTLGVDSTLVDLDIGADGVLVPPVDPDVAGWLPRGAAPGELGPTVIAGHVDSSGTRRLLPPRRAAPRRPGQVGRSDGVGHPLPVVSTS